jgi:hypothetical protein
MEFSTVIIVVGIAAVAYFAYKAFTNKADTNQDGVVTAEEAKIAVQAIEDKVEKEVKVVVEKAKKTATKAKTAVKKTTTRKPRAK